MSIKSAVTIVTNPDGTKSYSDMEKELAEMKLKERALKEQIKAQKSAPLAIDLARVKATVGEYKGKPTLEIILDGSKERNKYTNPTISFGLVKAKMLMARLADIQAFVEKSAN